MAAVLLCAMVMTTLLGQAGTLETKAAVAHFDGNDYRMSGQVDEGFYDDESSSVMGYTKGNPREGYTAIRKGIDVSHWQNDRGTIDWSAVKNSLLLKLVDVITMALFIQTNVTRRISRERLRQDFV